MAAAGAFGAGAAFTAAAAEKLHRLVRSKNAVIAIFPEREVRFIEECLNINDKKQ
jgi:hypothetical protein